MYGNNDQVNQQVRAFVGGRMRVEERNGQQWLPRALNTTATCSAQSPEEPCYLAGKNIHKYTELCSVFEFLRLSRKLNNIEKICKSRNSSFTFHSFFFVDKIFSYLL